MVGTSKSVRAGLNCFLLTCKNFTKTNKTKQNKKQDKIYRCFFRFSDSLPTCAHADNNVKCLFFLSFYVLPRTSVTGHVRPSVSLSAGHVFVKAAKNGQKYPHSSFVPERTPTRRQAFIHSSFIYLFIYPE